MKDELQMINPNAAGIYIGSEMHYVCVPGGRSQQRVQKFKCFTEDLHILAKWLKECQVTTVAMESTGVYWIPLFQVLESYGFTVLLVNVKHVKNVPLVGNQMYKIVSGCNNYIAMAYFKDHSDQMTKSVSYVVTLDNGKV